MYHAALNTSQELIHVVHLDLNTFLSHGSIYHKYINNNKNTNYKFFLYNIQIHARWWNTKIISNIDRWCMD